MVQEDERVLKNEIHICRNSWRKCSQTILMLILWWK